MLIILGGVQASGKTTIQKAIVEAYPTAISLDRTQELKDALLDSPRDIGTDNHLRTLYRILNSWDDILQTAMEDAKGRTFLLDAGPITTIAYNCLTLKNALLTTDSAWEHYVKTRTAIDTPHTKYLEKGEVSELLLECMDVCTRFLQNSFMNTVLLKHESVLALHLITQAHTIAQRFEERRNDIRVNNMQDWFATKQDEIDTYSMAYAFTVDVIERLPSPVGHHTPLYAYAISTSGSVSDTVKDVLNKIQRQRNDTVGA